MNRTPIELIPAIIKSSRPSQYEGESFTALEYVSKVAVKINECINEYNGFVEDVIKEFETFKNGELTDRDVFERRIEQMITDFKEVTKVKYKEQDTVINNAISEMLNSLPDSISKALTQMYSNGQFDAIVYDSIANLKKDFDSIVNNSNAFQSTINESFINLVADMELFKSNTKSEFNDLEQSITEMFDSFVADSNVADMQKAIYDANNNGVVDNSENLGGNPPEYFAKKQELESLTNTVGALNNSVRNVNTQVNTMQTTVSENITKVDNALNTANNALTEAQKKLGKTEQAIDSLRLNNQPASYYATKEEVSEEVGKAMPKSGGTFTGPILLANEPIDNLHPVNKSYFDYYVSHKPNIKALWSNPDTNSNFPAQTITLENAVNYDLYIITYKDKTNSYRQYSAIFHPWQQCVLTIPTEPTVTRIIGINDTNFFNDGVSDNNLSKLIPYQIIGIKFDGGII